MQRIGVFTCYCGSNISATVDVEKVAETLKKEPGVVFSATYQYMCSENGQQLIKNAIKEHSLTGIVVCACSPRMHETTFRKTAESVGLNPYMVEIANIREHCSWIHKDKEEATEKAIVLGRTAIAKLTLNKPLSAMETGVTKRALVIGGGIAGIQAALDIADAGYKVDIVEKRPTIGGRMAQLDKTFPTLDCSACILTPKMVDCAQHENVTIYSYSEVEEVKGFVGNFTVKIKRKARYIDETKCTGCGICVNVCPSKKGKDEFNEKLNNRPAVYIPFAQAIPNVAVIDQEQCIKLKTGKCGLCQTKCGVGAIDYTQKDVYVEQEYGAIVVATGYKPISLKNFNEYGYEDNPDVITSLELERLMNAAGPTKGSLLRPSSGEHPKDITFIQCVGSRDVSGCGKPYCSKICCMYTAKHAMLIREKYPDVKVRVFYIDVRTPGKNYDEFYRRAVESFDVEYIKGTVGKVYQEDGKLTVCGVDLLENRQIVVKSDIVVLATAIEPDETAKKLATTLAVSTDTNGFFTEAHAKLRPVESPTAGIYLAGTCQGPKDVPETVSQASACASKVIGLLSKKSLKSNPCVAVSNENVCNGCGQCANVCPYGAITYTNKHVRGENGKFVLRRVAEVNPATCQGCGACTVTCPSKAMDLLGFSLEQINKEVEALCKI